MLNLKAKRIYENVVDSVEGVNMHYDQLECGHAWQCRISRWQPAVRRRCRDCERARDERKASA
jgi:hypothetical protein